MQVISENIEFCLSIGFIPSKYSLWYEPINGKLNIKDPCKVIDVSLGIYYPDNLARNKIKFSNIKEIMASVTGFEQIHIWNIRGHN